MITHLIKNLFTFILCSITFHCSSQTKSYLSECSLLNDFIDSANTRWFYFENVPPDSSIILLDPNKVLANCILHNSDKWRIQIVSSGKEIDQIKKNGIFSINGRTRYLFILIKGKRKDVVGYSLYHPRSGGDFNWSFKEKNKKLFFFQEKRGYF